MTTSNEISSTCCRSRGYLDEDLALIDESESPLDEQATHHAAAIQGLIPFGPRAGRRALLFGEALASPLPPAPPRKLCADVAGYSSRAAFRSRGTIGENVGSSHRPAPTRCPHRARPVFGNRTPGAPARDS